MKKIVIYTNIPSPYRAALFQEIRSRNRDLQITVLYQTKTEADRSWSVQEENIRNDMILGIRRIPLPPGCGKKSLAIPKKVWRTLSALSPELVVISEYNPGSVLLAAWCRMHRIPYISWTDGTPYFERDISGLQKVSRRYLIGNAAGFLASSTRSRENQMQYGADPSRIVLSMLTIDTDGIRKRRKEFHAGKFLYVGRLDEIKGVDLLLKAFSRLPDEQWELFIVGDGKEESKLRELCAGNHLEGRVHFEGFCEGDRLLSYYRSCDVFILPSRREVFGLVILEAMCSSMPVICSEFAEGRYDLIKEGVSGVSVNPFDPEAFAAVIRSFCDDAQRVREMGEKAFELSLSFSLEKSAQTFCRALREF